MGVRLNRFNLNDRAAPLCLEQPYYKVPTGESCHCGDTLLIHGDPVHRISHLTMYDTMAYKPDLSIWQSRSKNSKNLDSSIASIF